MWGRLMILPPFTPVYRAGASGTRGWQTEEYQETTPYREEFALVYSINPGVRIRGLKGFMGDTVRGSRILGRCPHHPGLASGLVREPGAPASSCVRLLLEGHHLHPRDVRAPQARHSVEVGDPEEPHVLSRALRAVAVEPVLLGEVNVSCGGCSALSGHLGGPPCAATAESRSRPSGSGRS